MNECQHIIINGLERLQQHEHILLWAIFINSLLATLAIYSLVVNFPEYNEILIERRALLEMS